MFAVSSRLETSSLDTLNTKIRQLFQILDTEQGWCINSGGAAGGAVGGAAAGAGV